MIPSSLRKNMKEKVHAGHIGIDSSLRRARYLVYWSHMSTNIRHYVETCGVCATYADKKPTESMVMTETPKPTMAEGKDGFVLMVWKELYGNSRLPQRFLRVKLPTRHNLRNSGRKAEQQFQSTRHTAHTLSVTMDHSMYRLCSENSPRTGSLCTRLAVQATAKPMAQPKRRSKSLSGC